MFPKIYLVAVVTFVVTSKPSLRVHALHTYGLTHPNMATTVAAEVATPVPELCKCDGSTSQSEGEGLCEGHGYNAAQCALIGCCESDGGTDDCHYSFNSHTNTCQQPEEPLF